MRTELIQKEHEAFFQTYKRFPIVVDKAEGCYIYDKDGNKYLDFLAGIAVNSMGYAHPKVIEAITNQLHKYMHLSNYFYQEPQIVLAEKLCEISGLNRVFFSNSGTEAIEGAIKLVRRWGSAYGKNELIAFSGGFHGRTLGALSIMDKPVYKDKMGPFVENCKVIEYNNPEELKKHVSDKTAAIFFECIQGEGGISGISPEFIKAVRELKQKYNFLVVADEIQTGIGRTGKYFAFQHFSFVPDVVTSSKAMGGGLPLGAIIAGEHLANVWEKTMHGTTFGGNAVACAAGLATINELQNGVLENVNKVGDYLKSKLTDLQKKYSDKILEVRGKGLMQGLLLSFDAAILVNALIEKHRVITNAASGKVLRLVPPLIITTKEVDMLAEAIDKCLAEI